MSRIDDLKAKVDLKTLHFILLSVATVGLYTIIWLDRTNTHIFETTKRQVVTGTFIVWIMVCMGLSGLATAEDSASLAIAGCLSLAGNILMIVWAFKARRVLVDYAREEHNVYLPMNGFYTFLFNLYYINYCINDLPQVAQRSQLVVQN